MFQNAKMGDENEPCKICEDEILASHKAMQCNYCEKWMHTKCLNMKDADYKKYQDLKDAYWFCKEDERKIQNFMAEKKTESKLLKEIKDIHLELREFREEANKQKSFADVIRSASTPSLFKTSVVQPKISKAFGVIVRPKDIIALFIKRIRSKWSKEKLIW